MGEDLSAGRRALLTRLRTAAALLASAAGRARPGRRHLANAREVLSEVPPDDPHGTPRW